LRSPIAHRLSTIRNADHIYVLEKGHIIQQGNFEQLTTQQGLFAQLMARKTLNIAFWNIFQKASILEIVAGFLISD